MSFSQRIVSPETPKSLAIEETVSPSLTSCSTVLSLGLSEITVTGVIDEEITPTPGLSPPSVATSGLAGTPGYEPETTELEEKTPPPTKTTTASPKIDP